MRRGDRAWGLLIAVAFVLFLILTGVAAVLCLAALR